MPKKIERARGGVIRYRTKQIKGGRYVHIAIVRRKGPRGGQTIAGPVKRIKRTR